MVVVIIGILSAIGAVKLSENLRKSKEGATYGNLGALRSALSVYYADVLSQHPVDLNSLTVASKYISALPKADLTGYHAPSSALSQGPGSSVLTDGGGWAYINDSTDANFGTIWVNCTHTDTKRALWTSY